MQHFDLWKLQSQVMFKGIILTLDGQHFVGELVSRGTLFSLRAAIKKIG